MSNKIEWLAVLRGLNILLVVMLHIQLIDMSTAGTLLPLSYFPIAFTAPLVPEVIRITSPSDNSETPVTST